MLAMLASLRSKVWGIILAGNPGLRLSFVEPASGAIIDPPLPGLGTVVTEYF